MAAAYSMDLRERVINDADAGLSSKELAERYHVSRGWVDALKTKHEVRKNVEVAYADGMRGAVDADDVGVRVHLDIESLAKHLGARRPAASARL
jgi:hypothetical protein